MAQRKILLMSGSEDTLRRLSDMLKLAGDEIDVCADGSEAFQRVWTEDYDVIVAELGAQGVDGRDLYMALQNTYPELTQRMVFICAHPTEPLMDFAARTGVPFLQLPATLADVRGTMRARSRVHSLV
jgi:CheY-like chemotaxis protein